MSISAYTATRSKRISSISLAIYKNYRLFRAYTRFNLAQCGAAPSISSCLALFCNISSCSCETPLFSNSGVADFMNSCNYANVSGNSWGIKHRTILFSIIPFALVTRLGSVCGLGIVGNQNSACFTSSNAG